VTADPWRGVGWAVCRCAGCCPAEPDDLHPVLIDPDPNPQPPCHPTPQAAADDLCRCWGGATAGRWTA
jgi:hypothetical protein